MAVLFSLIIMAALICLYAVAIRPLLHKIPALAKFYADADGFWAKIWALCGHSLTMLWGHVIALSGVLFKSLDYVGPIVGDPDMKGQIVGWLQNHPSILAYGIIAMGGITVAARLRSIIKAA